MKLEAEVQDRIRYLLNEEFNRRLQVATSRLPCQCRHNHRHTLDSRKQINGEPNEGYNHVHSDQTIGLCLLGSESPEGWNGTICEDPVDAQRCPDYSPTITKEALWDEFHRQIRDLDWVRVNLPETYGLLWALGTDTTPPLPWWKIWWWKLWRIRPDPLLRSAPLPLPDDEG